jgi:hypothetical protein
MAFPGRPQTFALENCRDLLNKLKREIERFGAAGNNIETRKDFAFNAAVTAWQLCDWVFADMSSALRDKYEIHNVNQMREYARYHCRALHLCRQVATESKHYTVDKFADPAVNSHLTVKSTVPQAPIPLHFAPGCFVYFVDGKEKREAEDVFGDALQFWTQFIYGNEIAK